MDTRDVLEQVKNGTMTVEEAEGYFRRAPFEEMGFAKLDMHRKLRSGFAEVVFCSGKADEHLLAIYERLYESDGEVFGTRASQAQYELLRKRFPQVVYDPNSHILKIEKEKDHIGNIVVCTAGTADISAPVRDVPLPPHPADGADAGGSLLGRTHYVPPHTAGEEKNGTPELSYDADGVLLHRVEVYVWRSDYRYFDQFVQDAAAYAARPAPAEQPAREPFFSFFPQYVQMGRRQETWYLWWREQVRHGVFPDTDYAYILLYVFELINQPLPPVAEDRGEAGTVCRTLASVWMAYRHRYPQLDHYMCEWLCDFCLIHRLGVPADILSPALDDIVQISRMKEFYLSAAVGGKGTDAPDLAGARILLRHCCQYDYRKSKFAGGENAALFDRIIPGAVAAVLPLLLRRDGKPPLITMQDSTVTRDAYTGALCAYRNKRRLVVSYTSFSRSHELRFLIGDMVKHTENRLRRYIGVRSRLSVMTLPVCVREALDAYLDPLLPAPVAAPKPKAEPPRPAYEALYDLPVKPVSQEDAARIEQASWETTRILTEAFGTAEETAEDAPDVQESDAAPPAVDECATEATAAATASATRGSNAPGMMFSSPRSASVIRSAMA